MSATVTHSTQTGGESWDRFISFQLQQLKEIGGIEEVLGDVSLHNLSTQISTRA
jgi:hypothetical protein